MDFISPFFSHLIFSTVKKKSTKNQTNMFLLTFFNSKTAKVFIFIINTAVKAELPYWIGQSSSSLKTLLPDVIINCK